MDKIYYLYNEKSGQWLIKILNETIAIFDSEEQCLNYLYGYIHEV